MLSYERLLLRRIMKTYKIRTGTFAILIIGLFAIILVTFGILGHKQTSNLSNGIASQTKKAGHFDLLQHAQAPTLDLTNHEVRKKRTHEVRKPRKNSYAEEVSPRTEDAEAGNINTVQGYEPKIGTTHISQQDIDCISQSTTPIGIGCPEPINEGISVSDEIDVLAKLLRSSSVEEVRISAARKLGSQRNLEGVEVLLNASYDLNSRVRYEIIENLWRAAGYQLVDAERIKAVLAQATGDRDPKVSALAQRVLADLERAETLFQIEGYLNADATERYVVETPQL